MNKKILMIGVAVIVTAILVNQLSGGINNKPQKGLPDQTKTTTLPEVETTTQISNEYLEGSPSKEEDLEIDESTATVGSIQQETSEAQEATIPEPETTPVAEPTETSVSTTPIEQMIPVETAPNTNEGSAGEEEDL